MRFIVLFFGLILSLNSYSQNSTEIDKMISFAKSFLGTPYKWAGTTPSGFDCSGFISYVMGNFGISIPHYSLSMAELGETIKLSDAKPGDLMFFKGRNSSGIAHVAMVVEVTEEAINFIHSSTSRGVVIDNFKTSKYFISRYVKTVHFDWGER